MPTMQAMTEKANERFNRNNIGAVSRTAIAPGQTLDQACQALGIAATPAEIEYLSKWPVGMQEALRAAVDSAVSRGLPVTFAWLEGHYELTISEVAGTATSLGGMTVVMRSPVP